jgi:hypothetical protein
MRLITKKFNVIFLMVALWAIPTNGAPKFPKENTPKPAQIAVNGKLWLAGHSSLHPFESHLKEVPGNLKISYQPGNLEFEKTFISGNLTVLKVSLPILKLESGNRDLDNNLYAHLKASDFPEIEFELTNYTISTPTNNNPLSLAELKGVLSLAGITKNISVTASSTVTQNTLSIKGKSDLLMTDFGISPPVFMFVIGTDDKITVHFDLSFNASSSKGGPTR